MARSWRLKERWADHWKVWTLAAVILVAAYSVIPALASDPEAALASGRPEKMRLPGQEFARETGLEPQADTNN